MRIPPSAIVMSLLTAVPFGLAIRDHVRHKDDRHHAAIDDDDDFSSRDYDRDMREYKQSEELMEQQRAEERAKKAETSARRTKIASQLVGTEPASLGSLFTGVKLGASSGNFQPDLVRQALVEQRDVISVEWDVDATQLNGVTIKLHSDYDDDSCAPLASAVHAWGAKTGDGWENPATHQRANLDEIGCSVTIERYADLEHWLDRSDSSIFPINAIGQPADKLTARVRDHVEADDETGITWTDLGLAGGFGRQRFTATIEHGKIVTIEADLPDGMDLAPLVARLDKLTGVKGKDDENAGGTRWKGGKFSALLYNGGVPSLVIGKLP